MKNVLKFLCYSFLFLFLTSCEKKFSLTGLSVGFLYALVFCKEKPYLSLSSYLAIGTALNFSLSFLLYLYLSVLPAIILYVLHILFNKKIKLWATFLFVLSSQIIKFFLFKDFLPQAIGCAASLVFYALCIPPTFAILVRGAQYDLSSLERFTLYLFVAVLGAGAYFFTIHTFTFFYPVIIVMSILGFRIHREKTVILCLFFGLGAGLFAKTFYPIGYCAALVLFYYAFSFRPFLGEIAMVSGFIGTMYLAEGSFSLVLALSALVSALAVFLPYRRMQLFFHRAGNKRSVKTIIGRDREDIKRKISNVAEAYDNVRKILAEEETSLPAESDLAELLQTEFCQNCTRQKMCGDRVSGGLRQLVVAAMDNGKASPLDVSPALGDKCVRLPKLLSATNDAVKKYREDRKQKEDIDRGREMMMAELVGMSEILHKLSDSIRTGVEIDSSTERRIKERLGYVNIIATDVILYGEKEEVVLVVRKSDAEKGILKKVLSDSLGVQVTERGRREDADGTVRITFERMPSFGILYGECSCSAQEDCGDSRRVIKIEGEKILFVLSDGMGTGSQAERTANHAVKLIESFYRAGFDHKTVFGCVSKLLSLRKREDFSAVDVVVCDVRNACFDFIKQGGRESYLISGGEMETIEGDSLPMGILESAEPQLIHKKMQAGDYVLMLSDGVADSLNKTDLTELLSSVRTGNPQVLAERIIDASIAKGGKDDMTAIVIKTVKNRF